MLLQVSNIKYHKRGRVQLKTKSKRWFSLDGKMISSRKCIPSIFSVPHVYRNREKWTKLQKPRPLGDITVTSEGLQILTYVRHSLSSSELSWGCHTYCDMGHPFICHPRDTHTDCRAPGSGADTTFFYNLGLGFVHPTIRPARRTL